MLAMKEAVDRIHLPKKPAPATTSERRTARLLIVNSAVRSFALDRLPSLPRHLKRGDLLVVNDAATLPASLTGETATGEAVEVRLLSPVHEASPDLALLQWQAALFGAGDWRTPTENRSPPPRVRVGDRLQFSSGLAAIVAAVSPHTDRLLTLRFLVEPMAALSSIYAAGRPIQYSYHQRPLALWDQQTIFASAPVALEPPSAAMHLTWRCVFSLQAAGINVVPLTHATGVSSTGDAWIDAHLPFPERYTIPEATSAALAVARREGGRVIAAGTGVMRALESAANADGSIEAGSAVTDLKISPGHRRRVVDGLLTGMHETDSSHMKLVRSLAPDGLIQEAYEAAQDDGFLWHEYGDVSLLM